MRDCVNKVFMDQLFSNIALSCSTTTCPCFQSARGHSKATILLIALKWQALREYLGIPMFWAFLRFERHQEDVYCTLAQETEKGKHQ